MTPINDLYTQLQVAGWGWLIAIFLWLAGIAGMGSVAYYWVRRTSLAITLLVAIILALIFVVSDLTRPWNVPHAMLTALFTGTYNWFSWMAIGIMLLVIQLILLLIIVYKHLIGHRIKWLKWISDIASSNIYLLITAFFGFLVTIYSGFLISQASGIPLWNTPLIPILWIISASICAVALVEIISVLSGDLHDEKLLNTTKIGFSIDVFELFVVLSFIYVMLTVGTIGAAIGAEIMYRGELAALTWIGVIGLGIIYPLIIGLYTITTKRHDKALIISAALLALIGALILRYVILAAGVYEPLSISGFS
ncbi:MAG: NrfD/PsrC family molybdoenzyme membrane anchor subunit [Sulfolobales archaeon]